MTFKELLNKFEELKWNDTIVFLEEVLSNKLFIHEFYDSKLFIDELKDHKIDYNQEITKDNYDNSFIVIIDNKKYCITKRLTEDDII